MAAFPPQWPSWVGGTKNTIKEKAELEIISSPQNCEFNYSQKGGREDCGKQRDLFPTWKGQRACDTIQGKIMEEAGSSCSYPFVFLTSNIPVTSSKNPT